MGYFKYIIKKFFNKLPKKILIFIIIFLLLFINTCSATDVNVTNNSNSDAYNYYLVQADISWHRLLYRELMLARNNHTFNENFLYFLQTIFQNDIARAWYVCIDDCYYHILDENYNNIYNTRDDIYFGYCSFYNETQRSETFLNASPSYASNLNISRTVLAFNYTNQATVYCFTNGNTTNTLTNRRLCIPSGLERYIPNDMYDILYSIFTGNFNFENTNNILDSIDNHVSNSENTLNDMNDFMQDTTTSEYSSDDLVTSDNYNWGSTYTSTNFYFDSIFTKFYNAISDENPHSVTIPLKFGSIDKTFNFTSNSLAFLRTNNDLVSFIQTIWGFVIYYYILIDVYKLLNELMNGRLNSKVENIKTQLL